jgi:ligand-binding SRPBCC domain-containing protein
MTDIVQYKIPLGLLGSLGLPFVKKQLDDIFNYRRRKVEELFI